MTAKRSAPPQLHAAKLSAAQMRAALPKLDRRANELKAFDVATIADYDDPAPDALGDRYNETLMEVFGADSIEYGRYSIKSLYMSDEPISMSPDWAGGRREPPLASLCRAYSNGIRKAVANLESIKLVFAERLADAGDTPAARATRAFGELQIHPAIAAAAESLFQGGHHANAVENACKALDHLVQSKSQRRDLTGTPLMQVVFSPKNPILKVADLSTRTGQDEQEGMMFMFAGAMLGLRNPRAHSLRPDDAERAIEYIAFLSMLAKVVDDATH